MMLKKTVLSLICSSLALGVAGLAHAGAYGESEEYEEAPAPAPAPRRMQRVERREAVSDFARPGPYLQAGGVYAIENFDKDVFFAGFPGPVLAGADWDNSWGYSIRGGYRLHPWVAIEAQWEHYLNFDFDEASAPISGLGENGRDIESYMLSANGKVYFLHDRVQPYALVGLGWQNAQMERSDFHRFDEDAFAFRFGAGADIYLTDMVGLAAEGGYILPVTGELSDEEIQIATVSLSIFVRFL